MPFLIQGSVKEVFELFGRQELIASGTEQKQIDIDIPRTLFFGTPEQRNQHVSIWSDPEQSPPDNYCQGNMYAENLKLLFGDAAPAAFYNKEELALDEPYLAIKSHLSISHFAYIDEEGRTRGLLVYYRKDDPTKWIVAHTEMPNKDPGEAKVKILTSFDPIPFCVGGDRTCKITRALSNENALIASIGSPRLAKFISTILRPNNRINPAANRVDLFIQLVAVADSFEENAELLQAFDTRIDEVLLNPVFKLLRSYDHSFKFAPRQILDCFNHESPFYQYIERYVSQGDIDTDKRRLEVIVFLDKWNLNRRQDLFAADPVFDTALYNLINCCDHGFLANCLASDLKMKGLRFLMGITKNDLHSKFAAELSRVNDQAIWETLGALADMNWSLPDDAYHYRFICKYLLNSPNASIETLRDLMSVLTPTLQEVFEPIKLAEHLARLQLPDGGIEYLLQANAQLLKILPKYKEAATWRGESALSQELLSDLAERYKSNPADNRLMLFTFCSNPEQIRAAYSIYGEIFGLGAVQGMIMDPVLVFIINRLTLYGLSLSLLYEGHKLAVLKGFHAIQNSNERDACLILFAQNQLNVHEYSRFRDACRAYPQLAERVVALHQQGFSAENLKFLAFDTNMHRAANFLSSLGFQYEFNDLTPVFCQTCLAVADLTKEYKDNRVIENYVKAILPALMSFYSKGETPDTMGEVFGAAMVIAKEKLAKNKTEIESREVFALIKKSETFLCGQMLLFQKAGELGIPSLSLIMKNRAHANEAARALTLVLSATEADEDYGERRKAISAQVVGGFARLNPRTKVSEEITRTAVNTLIEFYLRNEHEAATLPFELLLTDLKFARVIPVMAEHGLSVQPLLDIGNPLNESILIALNNLNEIAPTDRKAPVLAMRRDKKGHDFRLLLTKISVRNQPGVVKLLREGIENGRETPISGDIATTYRSREVRHLAYRLDESLVLVNRLRNLEFDNDVIEFMLKNNEKSKYFCRAISRIEAECETIMSRLRTEHEVKFKALQGEPERAYRKALYSAMYNALNAKTATREELKAALRHGIQDAEMHIENIVQRDSHPGLRKAMMVIANVVLGLLTLFTFGAAGVGFYHHYQRTGDVFFYSRPASEESYRAIDKQTLEEVTEIISSAPAV